MDSGSFECSLGVLDILFERDNVGSGKVFDSSPLLAAADCNGQEKDADPLSWLEPSISSAECRSADMILDTLISELDKSEQVDRQILEHTVKAEHSYAAARQNAVAKISAARHVDAGSAKDCASDGWMDIPIVGGAPRHKRHTRKRCDGRSSANLVPPPASPSSRSTGSRSTDSGFLSEAASSLSGAAASDTAARAVRAASPIIDVCGEEAAHAAQRHASGSGKRRQQQHHASICMDTLTRKRPRADPIDEVDESDDYDDDEEGDAPQPAWMTQLVPPPAQFTSNYGLRNSGRSYPRTAGTLPFTVQDAQSQQQFLDANGDPVPMITGANGSKYPAVVLTEEERRLCDKEAVRLPAHYPLTKQQDRDLKRIRRKIRNKRSAQVSRRRKQVYVDELEQRMSHCMVENADLKGKVQLLQEQNRTLLEHLKKLQVAVTNGGRRSAQAGTCLAVLLLSFALLVAPGLNPFNNSNQTPAETEVGKTAPQDGANVNAASNGIVKAQEAAVVPDVKAEADSASENESTDTLPARPFTFADRRLYKDESDFIDSLFEHGPAKEPELSDGDTDPWLMRPPDESKWDTKPFGSESPSEQTLNYLIGSIKRPPRHNGGAPVAASRPPNGGHVPTRKRPSVLIEESHMHGPHEPHMDPTLVEAYEYYMSLGNNASRQQDINTVNSAENAHLEFVMAKAARAAEL